MENQDSIYMNKAYRVMFNYPKDWMPSKTTLNRYEGKDGFFQVALISSKQDLDTVVKEDAYHKLRPYGERPTIISREVDGHKARIILPDKQVFPWKERQSAVILQYKTPVIIEQTVYPYLIIWVQEDYLEKLVESIAIYPNY